MNVATQISGNIRPDNAALHALESMFNQIGISVTHANNDESFFYDTELAFYESIASSAFHVIYNDEPLDEEAGLQVLYAMLKNRPILMAGAPTFAKNLSPFMRQLIVRRLEQFHSVYLPELDLTELSSLLRKLKTTDYHLSNTDKYLIKAQIQARHRALLQKNN